MARRILGIILIVLAVMIMIATSLLAFTPAGSSLVSQFTATPEPTFPPYTPTPRPKPKPILTAKGTPPKVAALEAILMDADTGNILVDLHGETPRTMASTTKIMTALIAIQSADLDQVITVHADAVNEVKVNGGSSAFLVPNEQMKLREMLYGLMLPSGDDAAIAIADALSGSASNFVQTMNLYAQRLHLFQTHYVDPDGLSTIDHYTTAFDLVRLTRYAMTIPLFAQIVHTRQFALPPTANHGPHTWVNTNELLGSYQGLTGVKTGFTGDAGYCLVFAATRNNQHLIGVVLHSTTTLPGQRFTDAKALLNWGFALPLLPPY